MFEVPSRTFNTFLLWLIVSMMLEKKKAISWFITSKRVFSLKQGSGKLEKAEILELTVEYLKSLKSHLNEQQEKDLKKGELKEKNLALRYCQQQY